MAPEGIVKKSARQLDLFQPPTSRLERLPPQIREVVVELTADLIAAVWQARSETRVAARQEHGDE